MPADNPGEPRDRSLDERPTTRWTVVVALPVGDSSREFIALVNADGVSAGGSRR